jgi:hypothetical protein
MGDISLVEHADLECPADRVWAVVADYARDPEWRTGVITMVASPAGLVAAGTTTVEQLRLGGRTWRNDGTVTAVDPGTHFTWRTTAGADARGARSVEPIGPGRCRVTLELVVTPRGSERLLAPFLARLLTRNLRRDLRQLAHVVDRVEPVARSGARR